MIRQAEAFDRLLSKLIADDDYRAKRESDDALDEAFHEAIHALKRLRELGAQLATYRAKGWPAVVEWIAGQRLDWPLKYIEESAVRYNDALALAEGRLAVLTKAMDKIIRVAEEARASDDAHPCNVILRLARLSSQEKPTV